MNNEIKEILDNIKKCCEIMQDENFVVYQKQDIIKLLDYINNLQQENEKIKKMNMHEHKYGSDMEEKYLIEKTKNDRAVEYIKLRKKICERQENMTGINILVELLNILNDRSDE